MKAIDLNPITWSDAYQKALVERDLGKLLKHVNATEEALFLRWRELRPSDGHDEELRKMDLACEDLLRIKIDELGWPTPFSRSGASIKISEGSELPLPHGVPAP
jgi:hypothetical protein